MIHVYVQNDSNKFQYQMHQLEWIQLKELTDATYAQNDSKKILNNCVINDKGEMSRFFE